MQQPLYILSATAISPQESFDSGNFLNPLLGSDNNRLHVVDPDYSKFINPVAIRRMSRIIKMGISAGMRALQKAGIDTPDAIIVGTGKGSVTDTERFLNDMISMKEEALNPTHFIQSTYNSINGWLAMQTKCTAYNQTYVNRGFSLEMCLLDAQLLCAESDKPINILAGSFDEMSPDYYTVKDKIGYWKKEKIDSKKLLQHNNTEGSIGGEGTAFFTLSNNTEGSICSIQQMHMLQHPDAAEIRDIIEKMLHAEGIQPSDIDLLISGANGDSRLDWMHKAAVDTTTDTTTVAGFKHLCGEYDTSTGFGLWLATEIFQQQHIPDTIILRNGTSTSVKYILLVNHHILGSATLMLLKRQ